MTESVTSQLGDLRKLESGWYDGKDGKPYCAEELDWLAATWERHQSDTLAFPAIYPTYAGEVQAEWSFGHHEVILRIDAKLHRGQYHYMNMQSDDDDVMRELDLDNAEEWNWVFQKVAELQGEQI